MKLFENFLHNPVYRQTDTQISTEVITIHPRRSNNINRLWLEKSIVDNCDRQFLGWGHLVPEYNTTDMLPRIVGHTQHTILDGTMKILVKSSSYAHKHCISAGRSTAVGEHRSTVDCHRGSAQLLSLVLASTAVVP